MTTTLVHAPVELVFDLARDVREHTSAMAHTGERVVAPGRLSGLLDAGDLVCFRARHFGLWLGLDARVVSMEAPTTFSDEQVRGPFASLRHDHFFAPTGAGTLVTDRIGWRSPLGPVGRLADEVAVRRQLLGILTARNTHLKRRAEILAAGSAA
ncbi:SRPBCC family protein [Cryptosporangium phraense]|uniref:SRPBCC family protein n=1 Tax=Cryptosporangium phraense TaxID=2593070 RepID=A0A545AZ39_9ACTN|nr:SRPBCC family protein [Cryptosporangium phraense]TQS46602.1 SRPBCC family protein [Cryptosporangium phraense]